MTALTQTQLVPTYIESRIRRRAPTNCQIVEGSTPVVAFGEFRVAEVATLGINPSRAEFLNLNGVELRDFDRRLATRSSLGVSDLTNATKSVVSRVLTDCESYFERNPYRKWFDQLNPILAQCGASYYDGSACHLDLVQWATNPTWRHLDQLTQSKLLSSDVPFLIQQLRNENIQILLLNGRAVIDQLQARTNANLDEVDRIVDYGNVKPRIFLGEIDGNIKVVGWSANLQSSFGLKNELRSEIAERVGKLVRQL